MLIMPKDHTVGGQVEVATEEYVGTKVGTTQLVCSKYSIYRMVEVSIGRITRPGTLNGRLVGIMEQGHDIY